MPGPSYSFVFKCSNCENRNCENRITTDRGTMRDVFELSEPGFGSIDTINAVLHRRGWMRDELDHHLFCPGCAGVEAVE